MLSGVLDNDSNDAEKLKNVFVFCCIHRACFPASVGLANRFFMAQLSLCVNGRGKTGRKSFILKKNRVSVLFNGRLPCQLCFLDNDELDMLTFLSFYIHIISQNDRIMKLLGHCVTFDAVKIKFII